MVIDSGLKCTYQSENITEDTTSQGAINDWLGSKAHREAMLSNRYELVGFGISKSPDYTFFVAHFCDQP